MKLDLDTSKIYFVFDGGNPHFHVDNSYLVNTDEEIKNALHDIHNTALYETLKDYGYSRTFQSEFNEWKAHNILYKFGIARDRTGSVDIAQNEPKWKLFFYALLSMLFK